MKQFTIIFLITFISFMGFAQWSSDPNENTALSLESGEQAIPKVATSENGTTYVSWFSNESGNYNVRLQKLDVYGNKLWEEEGLLISDNHHGCLVDGLGYGKRGGRMCAILTFQDIRNEDNDVFAYRISPDGEFIWGEDGIEMSTGPAFDSAPKVTVTNSGNAVFAWQADSVTILQKISPEGNKLWGDNGISLSGTHVYSWPQLLPVSDDDVILKYFDDSGPFYSPTRHVFAQRYDADGNTVWGSPAIVSNAGGISAWTQIFPFINDGNDGFYMAWHDDRDMNNLASIYVQHIDADGNVLFADDGVEATLMPNRNHFYAQLALPPGSESIFIFWNEMDIDQINRGIYGQKISLAGERLWNDDGKKFIEISPLDVYPFAARNSDADMVVFYEENASMPTATTKAMRIDTEGNFVWPDQMVSISSIQTEKVHAEAGNFYNGQWITVWEDDRNGNKDIYGQNIQLDGTLGPIVIPTDLTVTPDSVICDVSWGHHVYVINNTAEAVNVSAVYFDLGWYVDFTSALTLPNNLQPGDSIDVEFFVIPGSVYNTDGYEYDVLTIVSEIGNYYVDIAINWDLLGAVNENNQISKLVQTSPNPAKDHITFFIELDNNQKPELYIRLLR
ncbi:MAG: hypothetical protein R2764_24980 [Bacteroidales bacterium]